MLYWYLSSTYLLTNRVGGPHRKLRTEFFMLQGINNLVPRVSQYLLPTELEVRTVSYGPSFFSFDLWPKREARGP